MVAGDLDGDGRDDLAAVAAGTAADGAGIYVIDAANDLDLDADPPVLSFSRVALIDLESPITAAVIDLDPAPGDDLVVTHAVAGEMRITAFRGSDLEVLASHELGIAAPTGLAPAWIQPIVFPGGTDRLVFQAGGHLRHLAPGQIADATLGEVPLIPAPSGAEMNRWTDPQAVVSFDDAGMLQIAVASTRTLHRSRIPTQPPPADDFAWSVVRDAAPWLGQLMIDLDDDAVAEVIGFSTEGDQLGAICAWSFETGAIVPCLGTELDADIGIELVVASMTPEGLRDELLVIHHGGTITGITLLPNLRVQGGVLLSSPSLEAGVPGESSHVTVADVTGDGIERVFVLAGDGTVNCLQLGQGTFAACAAAE